MPKPTIAKRANKNRPAQMSSARAVPTLRVAPGLSAGAPGHSRHSRDPRFDACSAGTADEHAWQQKYSFVFDQQRDELKDMQRRLSDSKSASKKRIRGGGENRKRGRAKRLSAEEAEELKLEINRRSNQLKQRAQSAEKQRIRTAARDAMADGRAAPGHLGAMAPPRLLHIFRPFLPRVRGGRIGQKPALL